MRDMFDQHETPAVRLSVPASHGHVRVARLTAAVVAERLNFDIEEIDDVLLAIDELTNALLSAHPTSEIAYRFSQHRGAFIAEAMTTVSDVPRLTALARELLGVAVNDYELGEIEDLAYFRVVKSSSALRS